MGRHVEPWWTVRINRRMMHGRIKHLKIGPLNISIYKLNKSDYSVLRGECDTKWHASFRWIFADKITTWMDGDCF